MFLRGVQVAKFRPRHLLRSSSQPKHTQHFLCSPFSSYSPSTWHTKFRNQTTRQSKL